MDRMCQVWRLDILDNPRWMLPRGRWKSVLIPGWPRSHPALRHPLLAGEEGTAVAPVSLEALTK
jgi:hypothetical protein